MVHNGSLGNCQRNSVYMGKITEFQLFLARTNGDKPFQSNTHFKVTHSVLNPGLA